MQKKNREDFYARYHTLVDGVEWQSLQKHLREVAQVAYDGLKDIDTHLAVAAKMAGLFHDYGKYNLAFQERLEQAYAKALAMSQAITPEALKEAKRMKVKSAPHAALGVAGLRQYLQEQEIHVEYLFGLLAYPILGHHAGLADSIPESITVDKVVYQRFVQEMQGDLQAITVQLDGGTLLKESKVVGLGKYHQTVQQGFNALFALRLIFSSLVNADHYTSAQFTMDRVDEPNFATMEQLKASFEQEYQRFTGQKATQEPHINQTSQQLYTIRRQVYQQCLAAAQQPRGIFSLTVPTGGGKTLASLGFALHHAALHGQQRIIYVAPFTSILDQTIGIYQRYLQASNVFAHYSTYDQERAVEEEDYDPLRAVLSESWQHPAIVTTAVQFWESLFSHKPGKAKKVHHIANSVILLDEVQSMPRAYLLPILYMMRSLIDYGCTIVLCSATQPQFNASQLKGHQLTGVREIVSDTHELAQSLERVKVDFIAQELTLEDLAQQVLQSSQVLVIVNSRKTARALAELLAQSRDAVFHLSGLMCVAHRQAVLAQVKDDYLAKGLPCYVVSTSLIEAGVDVDFPKVYREEAGLENLVQSAGRCNREFSLVSGEFVVFFLQKEWASTLYKDTLESYRRVRDKHQGAIFSLAAMQEYYEEIYYYKGDSLNRQLDKAGIVAKIYDLGEELEIDDELEQTSLQEISKAVRFIDDLQYRIVVPYQPEVAEILQTMKQQGLKRKYLHQLAPYTVGIYPNHFQELYHRGYLIPLKDQQGNSIEMYFFSDAEGAKELYDERWGLASLVVDAQDTVF